MSDVGLAISLFSGAGGFDLGVEAAGFKVAAAVEIDHDAADTMEKNFKDLIPPCCGMTSSAFLPGNCFGQQGCGVENALIC